jgi:hypothetical protein
LFVFGCWGVNTPISVPRISPSGAATQALAQYDANKDGVLAGAELDQCPALKRSLRAFDKNGDGKLDYDELYTRINTYLSGGAGALTMQCRVTLDGQPVEGVTVKLIPEAFMGGVLPTIEAVSNAQGDVTLETKAIPGVPPGLYRVEVSRKDGDGKETLPAKYNTKTTFGCESAQDDLHRGQLTLDLLNQ